MAVLLNIQGLTISHGHKKLVQDLDFHLDTGEILGLIGKSGSGKSLTSLSLLQLLPQGLKTEVGSAYFEGIPDSELLLANPYAIRGKEIAIIFQEPMATFNPTQRMGPQILENTAASLTDAFNLLEELHITDPKRILNSYPHQLSGGELQRASLAMALIRQPRLLLADEPTTALDPHSGREFLNLLRKVVQKRNLGCLFISHDIDSVRAICDRVVVLLDGQKIEEGKTPDILEHSSQSYTQNLIASEPQYGQYPLELGVPHSPLRNLSTEPVLEEVILKVENVSKSYGHSSPVLKSVSLELFRGEVLGIMGASGSGKTTLGKIICGIEDFQSGSINLDKGIAKHQVQIVFQDPYSVLNSKRKIGAILTDVAQLHQHPDPQAAVVSVLEEVGIDPASMDRFPAHFSGGQRQRINIARTLLTNPKILVLDESVAALDVFVQAQVLNLLNRIREQRELSLVLISHDPRVMDFFCNRVVLLKAGVLCYEGKQGHWIQDQHPDLHAFLKPQ